MSDSINDSAINSPTPEPKSQKKKKNAKKKVAKKKIAKKGGDRLAKQYPGFAFEEVLKLAENIFTVGSGKSVRRITLFDHLGKSPDSSSSRQLITNSNKYGLTRGSYVAESLELTEDGLIIVGESSSDYQKLETKIRLAIENIPPFNLLYAKYIGSKLPARSVMLDTLLEAKVNRASAEQLVDLFVVNTKYLGLLQELAGAERLVTKDHVLEQVSRGAVLPPISKVSEEEKRIGGKVDFNKVCFYITSIGEEGSLERKHSDLFLGSIIEPALEQFKLEVIRADKIENPGMITKQIIEYIVNAKLVIADLSFNNPNVFYELAIRHACRKPTVQVIKKGDKIPFDVGQSRTIIIDCTDIYSLVPKLELHRSEISTQVSKALSDENGVDNPLNSVYPNIKLTI